MNTKMQVRYMVPQGNLMKWRMYGIVARLTCGNSTAKRCPGGLLEDRLQVTGERSTIQVGDANTSLCIWPRHSPPLSLTQAAENP
jgi:hypothetical protein